MSNPEQVYTIYIKTTPEKLWEAITNPEFTRQYWAGHDNISEWRKGSPWKHVERGTQAVRIVGEVVESIPHERLVLTWADPSNTSDVSRVTFEIEARSDAVRLNVIHGDFKAGSTMAGKVANGWPRLLSSLKSFLETGNALDVWGDCGGTEKQAATGPR